MRNQDPPHHDTSSTLTWKEWINNAARTCGYDIDSPRGGDKTRLANESGIPVATISRILSGAIPTFETMVTLSRHLHVPLRTMLIRSGKVTDNDLPASSSTDRDKGVSSRVPLTPEEVAAAAGVDHEDLEWFAMMVRRYRRRYTTGGESGTSEGAAASGE